MSDNKDCVGIHWVILALAMTVLFAASQIIWWIERDDHRQAQQAFCEKGQMVAVELTDGSVACSNGVVIP